MLKHTINIAIYGNYECNDVRDTDRLWPRQQTAWTNSMFDPRDARLFTPNGQEAFAFWANENGNYYAIIIPSRDKGNGRLMILLNAKGVMSKDGKVVLTTLRSLREYIDLDSILSRSNFSKYDLDNHIFQKLSAVTELNTYIKSFDDSLIADDFPIHSHASSTEITGYRVFTDEAHLAKMFANPHQREYLQYKCVYFVPCDKTIPDPTFNRIDSAIMVQYHIADVPSGVEIEPNRLSFFDGDTLTIYYKKNGYEPQPRSVHINGTVNGNSTHEIYYIGNEIHIHSAKSSGIVFYRNITLTFIEKGTSSLINDVSVKHDGQAVMLPFIPVAENTKTMKLEVSKPGYKTKDVTIKQHDIEKGSCEIELERQRKTRKVTVIYPDSTQDLCSISFEENSPTDNYLAINSDVMYISRKGLRPQKPQPPKESFWDQYYTHILAAILGLIFVGFITLILWFFNFWPFETEEKVEHASHAPTEQVSQASQPDTDLVADRQADLDYLKTNDSGWDKSRLKTDECKQLIDYIMHGQVKEALEHPYHKENTVNGHWKSIISIYHEIKGKVSDNEIGEAFRHSVVSNDIINVEKLHSEMAELERRLNTQSETSTHNAFPPELKTTKHENFFQAPAQPDEQNNNQPANG